MAASQGDGSPRQNRLRPLVQDNLSTHKPASLYEAFQPAEVRRLVERFEWHYTPKHGSRLDMAECERSVLSRQYLNRRIFDKLTLTSELVAWQNSRNKKTAKADGNSQPPTPASNLSGFIPQCE
jgi:hypothetical protein